ncbi:serine/threonine-protein kinase [Nocardia rhamnosiphila]
MVVLEQGTIFAGYRIERLLGAGGMAAVYLARHPRLPRWDAVKIADASSVSDPKLTERFHREAELAARLTHRNIVAVYDRGIEGDRLWIAMQYIEGTDAARLIHRDGGRLSGPRSVHIVREAARGLDHAHAKGLLHRDVKPANLLIADTVDDDGDEYVLVTDFGIARTLADSVALTSTGTVMGTPAYIAPEQIEGTDIDARTDVYALGASLYTMLTGAPPFLGATPLAAIHAHLTQPPPRPSAIDPGLAPFDDIITTAMAKNRNDRYPTCRDLAAASRAALDHTVPSRQSAKICSAATNSERVAPTEINHPAAPDSRPGRAPSAWRWGIAALAVAVLAIGLLAWTAHTADDRTSEASTAPSESSTPAPPPWGAQQFIADKFPGLVPVTPDGVGYRRSTCDLPSASGFTLPAIKDRSTYRIYCNDDGLHFIIECSRDGSPADPVARLENTWQRWSATGTLRASDLESQPPAATLDVTFDRPDRSGCQLSVNASGWTADQLLRVWWASAPI